MLIVKIGGPAYRIGMGGGAASSVPSGSNRADLDFNAVQVRDAMSKSPSVSSDESGYLPNRSPLIIVCLCARPSGWAGCCISPVGPPMVHAFFRSG